MEAAAHQMRMRRLAARAASSAGMMVSRKCSNGSLSRKKNDSLVVIASTTSTMSGSASGALQPGDEPGEIDQPGLARDRQQPALDQILLLGRQHEAGALLQQLAQIIVIVRASWPRPQEQPRRSSARSDRAAAPPSTRRPATAAPGMPQTTLVASSCAITLPPAVDDLGGAVRCRRCPCRSGSAPDSRRPRPRPPRQTADRPRACRNAPAAPSSSAITAVPSRRATFMCRPPGAR